MDVGCGSGVLAIAAARLGYGPVLGLDHDPAAVAATRENAGANGVAVDVRRWDLRTDDLPDAPVVVANLVRPLLLTLAGRMTARPEVLIASGLLAHEADEVAAAVAPLVEQRRLSSLGWSALLLTA